MKSGPPPLALQSENLVYEVWHTWKLFSSPNIKLKTIPVRWEKAYGLHSLDLFLWVPYAQMAAPCLSWSEDLAFWPALPSSRGAGSGGLPAVLGVKGVCKVPSELVCVSGCSQCVCLLGGRDKRGGPILTFPARSNHDRIRQEDLRRLISYLACIPRWVLYCT